MKRFYVMPRHALMGVVCAAAMWAGCDTPTITALDPTAASEGNVVEVTGTNLTFANLQFDGVEVPTPWYGASFFTVPYGSAAGAHNITASNSHGTSAASALTVNAPVTIPAPDISGVQLGYVSFAGAAFDAGQLWVYGSNIDCGATILIDGSPVDTYTSQVLVNDFCGGVDPTTFGTPAYHYISCFTALSTLTPGATVSITVQNLDGETSGAYSYTLPATVDELDSDGDGLLDSWESSGYDADGDGIIDVDLPGMGCDIHHQDLLVEVDIMMGLSYTPASTMWELVEATFANAPVMNVDGEQGIAIHIDRGQGGAFLNGGATVTFATDIDFTAATSASNLNFFDGKNTYFDPKRLEIFRYCIWGYSRYNSTSSGQAEGIWSNDFLVGIDAFGASYNDDLDQAETFVHELGHTLNLGHGGPPTDGNAKETNHLSVMSYVWQFLSTTLDWETCESCYNLRSPGYSEGMAADLVESALNENLGVCDNTAIDWDLDGTTEASASFDIDQSGVFNTLTDYDEWHNLKFNFTASGSDWDSN